MKHTQIEKKLKEAEEYIKQGTLAEAERLCGEVLEFLPDGEELTLRSSALRLLAESLRRRGTYSDSLPLAKEALAIAERAESKLEQIKAMNLLGLVLVSLGDYIHALEYYEKALKDLEEIGNKEGAAIVTGNIGNIYTDKSDYSRALEYYEKALAAHEELGMRSEAARVTGNMGNVHWNMGDYTRALKYYETALTAHKELGNKAAAADVTGNIGNVHLNMSDYTRSLEYYAKALAAHEELGNKAGAALVIGNIGIVHLNMGDYPRALEYYGIALGTYEEVGDKAGIAFVTGNTGIVYDTMGDYSRALEYYRKALAAHEEIGNKRSAAIVTGNIGLLYTKQDFEGYSPAKAEEILLNVLSIDEEVGAKKQVYGIHKSLAYLYEQAKRWEEAHEHFKKYHNVFEEVQSEESTRQAQLMEHRRKIEDSERDRQIKLARFQEQEKILHKTLPPVIADRLIAGEKDIADRYESVSILFADIVGFTPLSARKTPREVVQILNNLFSRFDKLTEKYGVERIKTIGDAYMVVSGAPEIVQDHALRVAQTALGMVEEIASFNRESGETISVRIGVNSGEAIAAVVGDVKFTYDLWSDAVNTASRMESHGEAGKIHCTEEFKHAVETVHAPSLQLHAPSLQLHAPSLQLHAPSLQLHAPSLQFIRRGEMEIKGKGIMNTYFLEKAEK